MTRDLAASVRQKLLDRSKSEGRPFQELLQYYAMERFLYRLANSPHAERFILKGALLLTAWQAPQSRSTVDIDLEGRLNNDPETMAKVIRDVCRIESVPDGIHFDSDSLEVRRIKEDAEYEGVRARFDGELARARIRMRSTSASATSLLRNHRHWNTPRFSLFQRQLFEGELLAEAIAATFRNRSTPIERQPVGLTPAFANDPAKIKQWGAFRALQRSVVVPEKLEDVVASIADFCLPVLASVAEGAAFKQTWNPGARWEKTAG